MSRDLLRIVRLDSEPPPAVVKQQGSTLDWLAQESDNRQAMYLAAQAAFQEALQQLIAVAEALCPEEWDRERADPETTPVSPAAVAALIIQSVERQLRLARLAAGPAVTAPPVPPPAVAAESPPAAQAVLIPPEPAPDPRPGRRRRPPPADPAEETEPERRLEELVRFIAAQGVGRPWDIRKRLAARWGLDDEREVQALIKTATLNGWLDGRPVRPEYLNGESAWAVCLSETGRQKAESLGIRAVQTDFQSVQALHHTAEEAYGILDAADILQQCGYLNVNACPPLMEAAGQEYRPALRADEPGAPSVLLIEYERALPASAPAGPSRWQRAAFFGGGTLHVIAPDEAALGRALEQIRAALKSRPQAVSQILAFSIGGYRQAGAVRKREGLWTKQEIDPP